MDLKFSADGWLRPVSESVPSGSVQLGRSDGGVVIRSADRDGPVLWFSQTEMSRFLSAVREGQYLELES